MVAVIPPDRGYSIVTRRLIYTAITRARKLCVIVSTREALNRRVREPDYEVDHRRTLQQRLLEGGL